MPATRADTVAPATERPGPLPVRSSPGRLGGPECRQGLPTGGSVSVQDVPLGSSAVSVAGPYVLLAEDDVKLAGLVTRALGHAGLATLVALTGDAALAAMRLDSTVLAVILDVRIPHPDGLEVCRQLRRDGWDGPVVAISALDSPDIRTRARDAGADMFLPKPFSLAELRDTIVSLVTDGGDRSGGASNGGPVTDANGRVRRPCWRSRERRSC